MKLLTTAARLLAIAATAGMIAGPVASADHGRRGHGAYDNHRTQHNHRRDTRRDHHTRRDHRTRRDRRAYRNDHRRHHARRDHRRYTQNYRSHTPRYNYRTNNRRYAYQAPRRGYSYPYNGNGVTFSYSTGPSYYNQRYAPRYSVGNRYGYHPRTVYVRDYGRYGLYDPPRGYHWVHDDDRGDAILASVATGAIIGLVVGAIAYD